MMLVKASEQSEAGVLPDKQLFAAMAKYNSGLQAAGVLIALDGLQPSSAGARVSFSGGKTAVTDGPFPNPRDLVAGYWIIRADSLAEAIGWAKRVPFREGVVEVRPIQEVADFPPEIRQVLGNAAS